MARLLGFQVGYSPDSVCYHKGSATFGSSDSFAGYLNDRNMLRVMMKNYALTSLLFVLPLTITLKLYLSLVRCAFNRDLRYLSNFSKALLWNVINLRSTIARRHCIQSRRKESDRKIWSNIVPYELDIRSQLRDL
jgi:GT2 family glycosyltransferase